MSNSEVILENILQELKKLNDRQEVSDLKEWYPLWFHFYIKGYYVYDRQFGSNKWGFRKIGNDDMKLDYDYEFDSLYAKTEYRSYKPAFRLVINGQQYPEKQQFASEYSNYDDWREFTGHNYNYMRCFQFSLITDVQSNVGHAIYPFKMLVKAPWSLNFEVFVTTTSNQWCSLQIHGWKIHKKIDDRINELEKLADKLND